METLPANNCKSFGDFFVHSPMNKQYFINIQGVSICLAVNLSDVPVKFIVDDTKVTILDLTCEITTTSEKPLFELSLTQGLNIAIGNSLVSITSNEDGISCDIWCDVHRDDESTVSGYVLNENFKHAARNCSFGP